MLKYSIQKVLIVGLGLIGGSFAKALKSRKVVSQVSGFDLNASECRLGLKLGVIDVIAEDLSVAVTEADLVLLAVPVKAIETVLAQIQPWLREDTLLTDVGSTKSNIVAAAEQVFGRLPPTFIPGHPIAGAEKSGVQAADADLFERHKVILTPSASSDPQATLQIARLWQAVGAEVLQMEPQRHDEVLAATSHLPHLLAFSLVDTLAREESNRDIFRYAAGGFRDFTRIAASDPVMWRDICHANRNAVLQQLDQFTEGVSRLRTAIEAGDSSTLLDIFSRAKAARDHFTRLLSGSAYARTDQPVDLRIQPRGVPQGRITLPGDRSISHRAIMLGALAEGVTDIDGFLEGEDSQATLQAFREMGVVIEGPHEGRVRIYGVGLQGLQPPPGPLYLSGSAVTLRLMTGLLAAQSFASEIFVDEALSRQSLQSVIEPLRQMGADIRTQAGSEAAPLQINPVPQLTGIHYQLPVASAQVRSALLLAGLYASGETCITCAEQVRDHTERMLISFGCAVTHLSAPPESSPMATRSCIHGGGSLKATRIRVPGDLTVAQVFIIMTLTSPGAELQLEHCGVNETRTALLVLLQRMGAPIQISSVETRNGEPVANITARYGLMEGIDLDVGSVPGLMNELPLLLVATLAAETPSRLQLPTTITAREYIRIQHLCDVLQAQGIDVELDQQQLLIQPGRLRGGEISSDDPAVMLALLAAAQNAQQEVRLLNAQHLVALYPALVEQAQRVGIQIHKEAD